MDLALVIERAEGGGECFPQGMDKGNLADHGSFFALPQRFAGVVFGQLHFLVTGAGAVLAIDFGPAAQKFLALVDDGTLPLLVLPGHLIEDDDPGLEAVIAGVTLCHLQVAVLAQNDGAGGVLAVVIVVDEVGFLGKGIQAVLLAGLEENLAFGIGGFLTDEVADIREADGHVLAVGRSDLHGLGRAGSLQSAALGGTLLHCSHPGGGGGASGVCGHGGRRCAGTRKSHK